MNTWKVNLLPKQKAFYESMKRFPAMVSSWGTGKTMTAILKGLMLSQEYPNNLGMIVRQDFTDLRDSTMRDFETYTGIKVPTSKDVVFKNGSRIMFRHGSELKKLQNINLGWFLIEQGEEFESEQEFMMLRGRMRRPNCKHCGMVIANTNGHNWIYRLWKCGTLEESELIEMTSFENPHLPPETTADWKRMEKESPATYRRMVMNSWEDSDMSDKIIPYEHLMRAVNRELIHFTMPSKVIACDPAEFGDDHTVIYGMEGAKIVETEILSKKEPMETAGRMFRMQKLMDSKGQRISLVGIDADGIGSGIRSRCSELGMNIVGIKSGMTADDADNFANVKAEMWWNAQEWFREDRVSLPPDDKLIEDLAAHSYTMDSHGKIRVEPKQNIKKKLGRSPDQGDCFVIGLWLLKQCPAGINSDELRDFVNETDMAMSYSSSTRL